MNFKNTFEKAIDNWPAKIICFVLALFLFLFYRMSTLEQRFISVPLEIESNGDLVPASSYPKTIKVTLKGETNRIYPINDQDVKTFIDVSRYVKEGEYRVSVQAKLTNSTDVSPLEVIVDPSEIVVRLEHKSVKKVPIVPAFKGFPEAGYEFSSYILNPSSVEITGPRSSIEKTSEVMTETIELSGRNSSFGGEVSLITSNSLLTIGGSKKIAFQAYIEQAVLVKSFDSVPLYFENLDPSFAIISEISPGTIQLKGVQTELSSWIPPEKTLSVLCEKIHEEGVYVLPVVVLVPSQFEVVSRSPTELQIEVRRKSE